MKSYKIPGPIITSLASLFVAAAFIYVASAKETSAIPASGGDGINISYPVSELGNCGGKEECRAFCDKTENALTCTAFAEKHGLVSQEEAARNKSFVAAIEGGGGPGGCSSASSCEAFCGNIKNLDVCISFAKAKNIKTEELDEAEKISSFIKSGGQMPGGCISKESCEAYCGNFSHAEECFNFAEKAGITQTGRSSRSGGPGSEPSLEQLKKIMELAKNGETPGDCKSKDQCESYCASSEHLEECLAFGTKIGLVSEKEAEMFKKTGGKGPGGCNSRAGCEAFCSQPENQETCFKFGKENGLISEEELNRFKKEGGFLGREEGPGARGLQNILREAPPEVKACITEATGGSPEKAGFPNQEMEQKIRACFEGFQSQMMRGDEEKRFGNIPGGLRGGSEGSTAGQPSGGGFSPRVAACIRGRVSDEDFKTFMGGNQPSGEVEKIIGECMAETGTQVPYKDGITWPRGESAPGVMPHQDFRIMPPRGETSTWPQNFRQFAPQNMRGESGGFPSNFDSRSGRSGEFFGNHPPINREVPAGQMPINSGSVTPTTPEMPEPHKGTSSETAPQTPPPPPPAETQTPSRLNTESFMGYLMDSIASLILKIVE